MGRFWYKQIYPDNYFKLEALKYFAVQFLCILAKVVALHSFCVAVLVRVWVLARVWVFAHFWVLVKQEFQLPCSRCLIGGIHDSLAKWIYVETHM